MRRRALLVSIAAVTTAGCSAGGSGGAATWTDTETPTDSSDSSIGSDVDAIDFYSFEEWYTEDEQWEMTVRSVDVRTTFPAETGSLNGTYDMPAGEKLVVCRFALRNLGEERASPPLDSWVFGFYRGNDVYPTGGEFEHPDTEEPVAVADLALEGTTLREVEAIEPGETRELVIAGTVPRSLPSSYVGLAFDPDDEDLLFYPVVWEP